MGNSCSKSGKDKKGPGFQLTRPTSYVITEDILKEASEISEERLDEFRTAFMIFDKDKSHTIDASELETVLMSLGKSPTERDIEMMVTMADIDHNGLIDFEEFVLMMLWYSKNSNPEDELRQAFRVFDKDADGLIRCKEFKEAMMDRGDMMDEEEADEMVRDADVNKDGVIDYEKFIRLLCAPTDAGYIDSVDKLTLLINDDYTNK